PRRIERRLFDLVERRRLLEVRVRAGSDKAVVAVHGLLQRCAGDGRLLVRVLDAGGELRDGVGAEEIAVTVDVRRLRLPFLSGDSVGIEDRPDRAAAVELGLITVI